MQRFTKNYTAFRCSEKQEHLNSAKMQIQALNTLTASVLQEFQQPYPRFRCSVGRKHRRVQTRPTGTSGKGLTERHHKPPHASEPEPKPQKPSNQLNNFQLQRFTKKPSAFRYTGKQQHLNSAKTQIQAPNTLITSVLQEFQQQYPRFRCSVGMKHRRVQTRPAGTSGKDLTERHHKPPHASEPEQKP